MPLWLLVAAVLAFAVVLWGGYSHNWRWTGINGQTATLWDWLHLLLLPMAVALLPIWLTRKAKLDPLIKRIALAGGAVFAVIVLCGYLIPWAWTGFTGNSLWDWLNLVALPLAVALTPLAVEIREGWTSRHTALGLSCAAAFAVIVLCGYVIPWAWTGFTGNTLWDWLHLLLPPLLLQSSLFQRSSRWHRRRWSPSTEATGRVKPRSRRPLRDPIHETGIVRTRSPMSQSPKQRRLTRARPLPAAAPVGVALASLGGVEPRVLTLVQPPLDQRQDMITAGKNAITMNIALVMFWSVVSPNQPWPPSSRANATGANVSSATTNIVKAIVKRARRTAHQRVTEKRTPSRFRTAPLGGPDALARADRRQRPQQRGVVVVTSGGDLEVVDRRLEHLARRSPPRARAAWRARRPCRAW